MGKKGSDILFLINILCFRDVKYFMLVLCTMIYAFLSTSFFTRERMFFFEKNKNKNGNLLEQNTIFVGSFALWELFFFPNKNLK